MSTLGWVGLGLSTSDARAFMGNLQTQITTVTNVIGEMQQQQTPTSDEISGAISSANAIENALRGFIAQDGTGQQYASVTTPALNSLLAVEKFLYDEQQNVAQHQSTGFVQPADPAAVSAAVSNWTAVLQNIGGGLQTLAAQIDNATSAASAQASAGAAAQAAAQAAQANGSSSPGAPTTSAPPPASPMPAGPPSPGPTTPAVPPSSSSSSAAPVVAQTTILGMTPPVALLAGVGVLLIAGLLSGYLTAPAPVAKAAESVGIPLPKKKKRRARR